MSTTAWIALGLGVVLVLLISGYLSHLAGRIDRAHLKVESTRAALLTTVAHRSALATEVAGLSALPAELGAELRTAAKSARDEEVAETGWPEESVLSAAIARSLGDELQFRAVQDQNAVLVEELASMCRRVQYSRRFHNDAVRQARNLRGRWLVRTFRLAGRAALPEFVDFDDSVPATLEAR